MKLPTNTPQPYQPITDEQAEEMVSYGDAIAECIRVADRIRRADSALEKRQQFKIVKIEPA